MKERQYASPHQLIAIPRSLRDSDLWRHLEQGSRDLYQYLLSYSHVRDFDFVYPSQERILRDLDIEYKTLIRHEKLLISAGILSVTPADAKRKDRNGVIIVTKSYDFTITKFLNADYDKFNNKMGGEIIYYRKKDIHTLTKKIEQLEKKTKADLSQLESRIEKIESVLDFAAQRMKYIAIDDKYNVQLEIYTNQKMLAEIVESELPKNVLLFPKKYTHDTPVHEWNSWSTMLRDVERKRLKAQENYNVDNLFRQLSKLG